MCTLCKTVCTCFCVSTGAHTHVHIAASLGEGKHRSRPCHRVGVGNSRKQWSQRHGKSEHGLWEAPVDFLQPLREQACSMTKYDTHTHTHTHHHSYVKQCEEKIREEKRREENSSHVMMNKHINHLLAVLQSTLAPFYIVYHCKCMVFAVPCKK